MKIIGVLSWYDESATWLSSAVAGFGRFCDFIVAVDGAYSHYPRGRPRSHPRQVEAITMAAETMGVGSLVFQPKETWAGDEIAKRNFSLALAGTIAEEGDWIAVFDADYHVLKCESEMIRAHLAECEEDVASYVLLDGKDFASTPELEHFSAMREIDTEWVSSTRDLYRWNPTLRVGPAHWHYSIEGEDGERVWLRGPLANIVDCFDLNRNLAVYHRTQDRALTRRRAQERYYAVRNTYQLETDEIPVGVE